MMYWYCNFIYYKPLQLHILINDIEEAICKYNEGVGLLLRIFAVLNVILLLVDNLSSCFLPKLIARNVSVMIDTNYYRHTVENYFSNRQMLHCNWYLYNFVFYQNISLNDSYYICTYIFSPTLFCNATGNHISPYFSITFNKYSLDKRE